ncbi:MAG: sulfotransferase, partial [Planctomycetales bacterium]|nr:sulfotransferase [Planctomycetales bacterium]
MPDFLIIGAARSGTTALAKILQQHPDIFLSEPKEPHFFAFADQPPCFTGPGDDVMMNRVAVTDPKAFEALFSGAPTSALRGEGSVSTLYYHDSSIPNIQRY